MTGGGVLSGRGSAPAAVAGVSILAAGVAVLLAPDWASTGAFHTVVEAVATALAVIVGCLALIRFYTKRQNTFLFVGTGFLGTALLDGYHAVITSAPVAALLPSALPTILPWSWVASRLFLSVFLWLSWVEWWLERTRSVRSVSEHAVYLVGILLTIGIFLFFTFVPLPPAYYPDLWLHRPGELLPGLFFLLAGIGYYRKGGWRDDAFDRWLLASLSVGVVTQIVVMAKSAMLYDAPFDAAHLLKILSYALVFVGLAVAIHDLFRREEAGTRQLADAKERLEREMGERLAAQKELEALAASLEERIADRTHELWESRAAALNMMEDAESARQQATRAEQLVRRHAAALTRSNAELQQFAYVASHDLQEPLRMIASYAQLLERRYRDRLDDDARDFIDYVVSGAKRLQGLINDLLMLSRVDSRGKEATAVDTDSVLDDVLKNLQVTIEESQTRIVRAPDLPTVVGDRTQIGQLLQNLIGNAIKYRANGAPRVEIGGEAEPDRWRFWVRDNGIGIDPDHQNRIFVIFQRLHGRDEYGGTGIGLALCKRIVERHGGRIWVESAIGAGSTFYFTLLKGAQHAGNGRT